MPMSLDHGFVRAASRRAGMVFTLSASRRRTGRNGLQNAARLSWAQVRAMRAWAGREGFGRSLTAQLDALQARYPQVHRDTVRAVLANWSWRDADYVPGQPDAEYWRDISLPVAVLHLIGGGR